MYIFFWLECLEVQEGGITGKGSDVEMVIYANQHW
jgi:hypothetical protein